jgi:hypothetical protein
MTTVSEMLFDNPNDGAASLTHELETSNVLAGSLVAAGDAAAAILDLLDIPAVGVVTEAWSKFAAVQKACEETRTHPGARQQVRAGHRTIRSTQHPRLEVDVDNQSIPLLTLELIVSLSVDAIVVTVTAGRISSVSLGDANGEATLTCGEMTLAKRTVHHVLLPQLIDIDHAPSGEPSSPPGQVQNRPETMQ